MLPAQKRLDNFEIVRPLGKGGMGEVYEAQQLNPPRRVALKVLAGWLAEDEDALRRFWREAAIPAQLDHPSIVRIISTGKSDDGIAYYTMQLIRGLSLAELIRGATAPMPDTVAAPTTPVEGEPGPPAEPEFVTPNQGNIRLVQEYYSDRYRLVARLGVQTARALASAHAYGCLHRDIKPSNIMVDQHDHLYLLDFGLTRMRQGDATVTRPGTVLGTPLYMSPEQARGEPSDHRSDVYSLGVTLYQLASGGIGPFTTNNRSTEAVLAQVRAGNLQPLRKIAPPVPRPLARIIMRAAHPLLGRRYQTVNELADALQAFLDDKPVPAPRHFPVWGRLAGRGLLGAAAVAFLGLLPFAAWHWWPAPTNKIDEATVPATSTVTSSSRIGAPENKSKEPTIAKRAFGVELPAGEKGLPFPDFLRKRPLGHALALFDQNHQPLWHYSLWGQGTFRSFNNQLVLTSQHQNLTLLALDNDPEGRWFEFAIDLNAPLMGPGQERLGVFFGWRGFASHFFMVEVDENPGEDSPHGRCLVSALRIAPGGGAQMPALNRVPLRLPAASVPLPKQKDWHHLVVLARDYRINLIIDGKETQIGMDALAQKDQRLGRDLDPRGALGIWAENGSFAGFRNAAITSFGESGDK